MKRNLLFFLSLWMLCAFTTTAVAEEVDYTSSIVNADLSTKDAWNTEGTKGINDGMVKVSSQAVYDFSQTITIPAGQYKLTAKAVYRYGNDEQAEYDAIKAGTDTHKTKLYVQTSAETFEANVFNRCEGASETDYAAGSGSVTVNGLFVPNSSAAVQAWFDADLYVNELVFNVLEEGQVKIGITTTDGVSGDYVNIGAWTLTRTGDAQNTGEGEGEGDDAALTDAKNALQALIDETKTVDPAIESLTEAIATAEAALATANTVEEVEAAQAALQTAYDAVADQIAYNKNVASVTGASVDNPIVTNFVVNGTFDSNGVVSPWKTTTGAQNQTTATNQTGAFTGNFFENWNPSAYTGKIYQEIKNIPNGVYELSICAFVSVFDASCQYVYGNDAKTNLTTGAPTAYKVVFEVTDNTAEIGFEQTVAKAEWSGIDNVSLTYYGAEASVNDVLFGSYVKTVEELRATATGLLTKVNDATKATLETALAGTETIESTIEAYEAAIATLNTAINAAKPNADVKVAIDNYYDLMASTNVYTQEAYNTFKAIADAYLAKWEADELTEVVVNPYKVQNWHFTNDYDDFLLSAWGTKDFDTNLYINTWSREGENDGSNFKVPFFEYWTGDDQSLGATTKTATITGLAPNAYYSVSAWVRVRIKNGATAPTTGISLSVGAEGTPVDVAAGTQVGASPFYIGEYTATGTTDANGTLTINFNVAADNNISWLSFKNVKYAGPSNLEFEVTMVNPAGPTAEKIAEGESVEFATNIDDKVGFMCMTVEQIDPATSEVVETITSFGTPAKGETSWKAEAYNTVKFREGFNYKFTFYAYESEDAYNQEPWEAPFSAAFAKDSVEIIGALPAYVYATATLNDIQPAYDSVIENAADSVVTLTFSAPVKVFDAQTVVREGGFMAPPTVYTYNPVAVDADENGCAAVWTMNIKLFPGYTNVTFAAEDAEGRRVWGNMGEEEESYFSYEWQCTVGIPDIKLATASAIVAAPVNTLTVTCAEQIDPYMGGGVVLNAAGEEVATIANMEKVVDDNLEMFTPEWSEAMATAPVTITLSNAITEPGTYTVKLDAGLFMINNGAYMSKATEAKFTVVAAENLVEVDVERIVNLGYAADEVTVDIAAICEKLGIESISEATVWGVNATTLEYVADAFTTCDGWMNPDGDFTKWNVNSYVCYKNSDNGVYALCTMPDNEPALGTVYTAYRAFATATDTVILKTNITFVAAPEVEIEIVKTITVNHYEKPNTSYSGNTATFDVNEVTEALGITSITEAEQFIMNVTDGSLVKNSTDGWRGANGDALGWGNPGGVCVKINDPASGIIDYIGCYDNAWNEGDSFVAKWAFVYEGKAVVIEVVIDFNTEMATGINGISAGDVVKTQYFGLNGAAIDAPVKGINIVKQTLKNGKVVTSKVYVK